VTNTAVAVTNGLFTTLVDFGNVYAGTSNWLELAVSTNGADRFSPLAPREQLTPVPYALYAPMAGSAAKAASANFVAATNIGGALSPAQLPASVVTNSQAGVVLDGSFSGNGSGLTGLNAAQLNGGVNGNFFVGPAGNPATGGGYNTAIGVNALLGNTIGFQNTAAGAYALLDNTNGYNNTANGLAALIINTSGANNTALGVSTLYANTIGSENTAVGVNALHNNNSGSGNIALGFEAGLNLTGDNNIDIGHEGVAGESSTIRIGTPGVQTNTFIAGVIQGDGSGLTSLNAANLTGTLSAANNFPVTLVTNLLNSLGPLPISKSFTSHGGTLIIFSSGSGYAITASTAMGMVVSLDGVNLATNKLWSNFAGAHLPFVPLTTCKPGVPAGMHQLTLTALSGTVSDFNDTLNVTVQELPY
jgi:hypothetical protein